MFAEFIFTWENANKKMFYSWNLFTDMVSGNIFILSSISLTWKMSFDVAESLFRTMGTQCNSLFISINLYCLKKLVFLHFYLCYKTKDWKKGKQLICTCCIICVILCQIWPNFFHHWLCMCKYLCILTCSCFLPVSNSIVVVALGFVISPLPSLWTLGKWIWINKIGFFSWCFCEWLLSCFKCLRPVECHHFCTFVTVAMLSGVIFT